MANLGGKTRASVADFATLIRPVISEKSAAVGSSTERGYVFRVDRRATKLSVKAAVENVYGVHVTAVRTMNYMGKPKKTARSMGRRSAFKKAYVTLKAGQEITVVEGV